jgi:hypothetical protein
MPAPEEVSYCLRLVLGFLEEARQDFKLGRWRSCVDNSQLATENAAGWVALSVAIGVRPVDFCQTGCG